jgi:hypothetical protein
MGRPVKEFDWGLVDSLCGLNASMDYVCERLIAKDGVEYNAKSLNSKRQHLERKIKNRFGITFVQYREKKIDPMRISVLKKQYEVAMAGNVTMLIWLGKQLLGQTDVEKSEVKRLSDAVSVITERIDVLKLVKSQGESAA